MLKSYEKTTAAKGFTKPVHLGDERKLDSG